ncbi:MAG TPA: hypothetical protein DCM86_16960 [Verrucomicrobiales bacterium]|nr:hypothetical protein [Verrucomicrobiales bacterium]
MTPEETPSAGGQPLAAWAEAAVRATQRGLPEALRLAASRVPVAYESLPPAELLADGIEPDTLGLFVGSTREELEAGVPQLPSKIALYLENLWEFAGGDRPLFQEEVRITYLHELGHYLGLDEEDLADRGLE